MLFRIICNILNYICKTMNSINSKNGYVRNKILIYSPLLYHKDDLFMVTLLYIYVFFQCIWVIK